jgi:hypothetical protein
MIEFCCLAVFGFSFLRTHFWPFTDVLKENQPDITRKVVEAAVPAGLKRQQAARLPPQLITRISLIESSERTESLPSRFDGKP